MLALTGATSHRRAAECMNPATVCSNSSIHEQLQQHGTTLTNSICEFIYHPAHSDQVCVLKQYKLAAVAQPHAPNDSNLVRWHQVVYIRLIFAAGHQRESFRGNLVSLCKNTLHAWRWQIISKCWNEPGAEERSTPRSFGSGRLLALNCIEVSRPSLALWSGDIPIQLIQLATSAEHFARRYLRLV